MLTPVPSNVSSSAKPFASMQVQVRASARSSYSTVHESFAKKTSKLENKPLPPQFESTTYPHPLLDLFEGPSGSPPHGLRAAAGRPARGAGAAAGGGSGGALERDGHGWVRVFRSKAQVIDIGD